MTRDPLTPDCSLPDCSRAASSLGLCREHRKLAPYALGIECAVAIQQASHEIGRAFAARALEAALAARGSVTP